MAEEYFCAHCDQVFVLEGADDVPRCPKCMRRAAVESVRDAQSTSPGVSRWLWVAGALVAAGAFGYFAYDLNTVKLEETPPLRPLEAAELRAYLERDQIGVGKLDGLFMVPEGGDWPVEPDALASALRAKTVSWSLDHPLRREVYTADETLAALDAADVKPRVYPLEAAAATTALMRSKGVTAMVAELTDMDLPAPPDPSGVLGYFVVAIFEEGSEPTAVIDPWGGRSIDPTQVRVINDTGAIGAALGIDAIRVFRRTGDASAALPLVEAALLLDPKSPSLRTTHGTILFETAGPASAKKELEAAHQLRPDGARSLDLVRLALTNAVLLQMAERGSEAATGLDKASQATEDIIERWPSYGRAHLVLAQIYLSSGDSERMKDELAIAERLDASSPDLWVLSADYYLSSGDALTAATHARRAAKLDPDNWQVRLQVARILLVAGDDDGAREHVDAALSMVSSDKRAKLEQNLANVFGAETVGGSSKADVVPGGLVLPKPEVGGAASRGTRGQGDPALQLGDPSNLRLRDPDQELELDLRE